MCVLVPRWSQVTVRAREEKRGRNSTKTEGRWKRKAHAWLMLSFLWDGCQRSKTVWRWKIEFSHSRVSLLLRWSGEQCKQVNWIPATKSSLNTGHTHVCDMWARESDPCVSFNTAFDMAGESRIIFQCCAINYHLGERERRVIHLQFY